MTTPENYNPWEDPWEDPWVKELIRRKGSGFTAAFLERLGDASPADLSEEELAGHEKFLEDKIANCIGKCLARSQRGK